MTTRRSKHFETAWKVCVALGATVHLHQYCAPGCRTYTFFAEKCNSLHTRICPGYWHVRSVLCPKAPFLRRDAHLALHRRDC